MQDDRTYRADRPGCSVEAVRMPPHRLGAKRPPPPAYQAEHEARIRLLEEKVAADLARLSRRTP